MLNNEYLALSMIVMFIVTLIPRALPITLCRKKINNVFIKSFLYYVPYAVLAALTIPAFFTCFDNIYISIIVLSVAIILSLLKQKLFVVCGFCICLAYALSFIF